MVRALPLGPQGLNPARIVAIATAIALHVAALLLLLVPATMPALDKVQAERPRTEVRFETRPVEIPPPPVHTEPVKPTPPTPQPLQRTVSPTPADAPVVDHADVAIAAAAAQPAADSATVSQAALPSLPVTGPVADATLGYVQAPAPRYPRDALTAHAQGTVVLRVLVDLDGTPLEVTVEHSSGNRSLDRAAQQQVLKAWKFQPASRNGQPVQAWGRVPVAFSLN